MKRRSSVSRRAVALLIVLGIALTLAPPVSAGEASSAPTAPIAAAIAHAARTIPLASPPAAARAAKDDQAKPGDELAGSSAFFTRPLGIAVLGILAAGTGYAVYSLSHDRIHSVARQGQ